MSADWRRAADTALRRASEGVSRLPGVAAIVTDRTGTIYSGAAGSRLLGSELTMTPDTVCALFSATKAITATAALQLVERGELDLDAPAKTYLPALGELQVIEGFSEGGEPRLRAPRTDITARMLLLHTAGFGYGFYNETYRLLIKDHGRTDTGTGARRSLDMPLLFDPGERWEYGIGIDWLGQVIEAVAGKRLSAVVAERVLAPLGMDASGFTITAAMRERLARMHRRKRDGSLEAIDFEHPKAPEVDMGGHGLYASPADYAKFLRMWLNDGMGPEGPILKPEIVAMAARDGLAGRKIAALASVMPALTHSVEFFPGTPKSWGMSFMINDEDAPTGRPAGSLGWAGLSNVYYWIDRENGIAGIWAAQLLPFADPAAMNEYLAFETVVYDGLTARRL